MKAEYDNGDEATKEFLEKKYGRKNLRRLFEDSCSEMWIFKNSKNCPSCGSSIQVSVSLLGGWLVVAQIRESLRAQCSIGPTSIIIDPL